MRKIIIKLFVLQQKKDIETGYIYHRLNKYNPLSYITIFVTIIVAFVMFGYKGMWEELPNKPFKWQ